MPREPTRLSAQDWARAALRAIARGGLAAVGVEPLARTLGVTKGSFYAHYRSRDELIDAALAELVRSNGDEALAEFAAISDPERRLRELIHAVVHSITPLTPSVSLSLVGDRDDPRVRDAVHRVDQARLDLLTRTYHEIGLPPARAAARARITYAAVLGLAQLALTDPGVPPEGSSPSPLADETVAVFLAPVGDLRRRPPAGG